LVPASRGTTQPLSLTTPATNNDTDPTGASYRRENPRVSGTHRETSAQPQPATLSRGQLVGILIAITMIAISVSTVVAIIVGRSMAAGVTPPIAR
jgi:hypothetical protein